LTLDSNGIGSYPLPWLRTLFLALSTRSGLDAHLTALHLNRVVVTEEELLECLAGLPSLEQLTVSDHELEDFDEYDSWHYRGVECHLVTNTLLEQLTLTANPGLVPRLRVLTIHSMMKFSDDVLFELLQSRASTERPFEIHARRWQGWYRGLRPDVVKKIEKLCRRRELVYSFGFVMKGPMALNPFDGCRPAMSL
jgi:hypothetical protein